MTPHPRTPSPAVAGPAPAHAAPPGEPTLREIGATLASGRWLILGLATAALACGFAYLAVAPPVYRATALVQIEETPADALDRRLPAYEPRTSVAGEVEIMRSRMLIAPVVEQLGLDVSAEPRHLPVLGEVIARRHRGPPAPPRLGLARFAWGGEQISVARFDVGDALVDRPLTLVAEDGERWRLLDDHGALLLEGRAGELAVAGEEGRRVELHVDTLVARPGTEFRVEKRRHEDLLDQMQASLRIAERGRSTGIVAIELDGPDPSRVAAMVSNLAELYVTQNVERRSAEAAKKLAFLESQLPKVKGRLEAAEASLNAFRVQNGIVDLPLEARATIDRTAELDREISNLNAEETQIRQRYGDQHPDLVTFERRIAAMRAERATLDRRIGAFPAAQLAHARLFREVSVATDLYTLLLERAQALQVAKSGTVGNVRIVDPPVVSRRPVEPRPRIVLALALLVGLGGGVAAALARRQLQETEEDAQGLQVATGLPILVTVPHSPRERELHRKAGRGTRTPLAAAAPQDLASEQLRTLRTVLGFVLKERGNVVAVSSPCAASGKSFVCANLAHLLAAAGKRVLLVDADLRRGALHRLFGVEVAPGLSEVASGAAPLEGALRSTATPGLDVLTRGDIPAAPAELLARPRLQETLAEVSRRYDVVMVDTPPALAVTDPVLVSRFASVTLFVLRAGEHRVSEIAAALERFARSGVEVQGAILNDVRPADPRYAKIYGVGRGGESGAGGGRGAGKGAGVRPPPAARAGGGRGAMTGWSCPHESNGICARVSGAYCRPGMKGCVLVGKVKFQDGVIPAPGWPPGARPGGRAPGEGGEPEPG